MSARTGLFAIVIMLTASSSSCLTVTTRVTTAHPGGGDACFEEPGKIPCDRDCNSVEDCRTPNNCCRHLCDEFQED
jgi:hypothetical protein